MHLSNIVAFIRRNHKALGQLSSSQLAMVVTESLDGHLCIVSTNNRDEINGIVLAKVNPEQQILHVTAIIAKSKKVLHQFLDIKRTKFSEWTIEGYRSNQELVRYNDRSNELIEKLFYA